MKILWFSNTPASAAKEFGYTHMGGGWIAALEKVLKTKKHYTLGICFFYEGLVFKTIKKENVSYYGLPLNVGGGIRRILDRHHAHLNDDCSEYIDHVLQDFKPDIIQVFGTEMGYGMLLKGKFQKVVFHLQGLVAPYSEVFFPPGISKKRAFWGANLTDCLRGLTFYHQYRWLKARAKREKKILKEWAYFAGRTDWDKNYTLLQNPHAKYFHCEELLRSSFFENSWTCPGPLKKGETFRIASTINPNMYKGLDLIYKVIPLLIHFPIEWEIYGIQEGSPLNKFIKKSLDIRHPLAQLNFKGQTGETDLINALKHCHLFIHPSYIDNSPNSVCEAMLIGMPVLSSAVGGVSSLLIHKSTGYLFNPHDRYDLAGWINYLAGNLEEAAACGAAAREIAMKRHDPGQIMNTIERMYNYIKND